MAVTPFKAMSFERHDVVTKDDLDQLNNNQQWIYEHTPRGRFVRHTGRPLDRRTVVLSGKTAIKKNLRSDSGRASVRFGKVFDPKCKPHVTTGIVADFQRRIFCVVNGPGGINYPNSNGFEVFVNIYAHKAKKDKIERAFWVHWHAFGFRRDDMK